MGGKITYLGILKICVSCYRIFKIKIYQKLLMNLSI